jgi:hypothetical protein
MAIQKMLGLCVCIIGWAAVARSARIDHVVIATTDVEAAARALSEKYGLATAGRTGKQALLRIDP